MGGSKPNFVPYPTFSGTSPAETPSLSALGRCRIYPNFAKEEFQAIYDKNVQQASVDENAQDAALKKEKKQEKKKYMKQGVAMAYKYLSDTLKLDVSITNVEIVLGADMIIASDGCIAACFLDAGCDKIVVTADSKEKRLEGLDAARIPQERIALLVNDVDADEIVAASQLTNSIAVVMEDASVEKCKSVIESIASTEVKVSISIQVAASTVDAQSDLVSTINKYFGEKTTPSGTITLVDPTPQQLGSSFVSCIRTDRPDGLFTTVVCTRNGEALGLVYSSTESVIAALECGRGVYYSRSRNGLWRKGDTSGHYQTLHKIDVDCDGDALRFIVTQRGDDCAAFCHLNTLTCWGEPNGLRHLEGTLKDRLKNAPAGSYTKRLFDDEELLRDKLVEEAQELSEADTKQHVAEELADVLYFAMVKAAKAGVSIDDAVAELDKRTRKVTRRKGDSKAFRIEAGNKILNK